MELNFNNINKKIVIYVSLIGFVLSFISGIVTGNSFANLFLKSIFSGIFISIVLIISNLLIIKFLPELLENEDSTEAGNEFGDTHVNIVMPEEEYKVQNNNEFNDLEDEDGENNGPSTTFKEVGFDNLENLSASSMENSSIETDDYSGSEVFSSTGNIGGDSDIGDHSVEDMAKAVKTVLKKD